jgi:uncharacterized protein (DUF58 family)
MIPNTILYTDNTIMIALVVCCVIVFAIVMISKVMRHRKQAKYNEKEQSAPHEGQELEMRVVPCNKSVPERYVSDYEKLFLTKVNISTRSGELVSIREKYHKWIAKIVQALDRKNVSIFSYIDNVLSHHFDTYQDEINEIYNRENDDDYIIPKN